MDEVWVLHIDHKHGTDVTVHRTEVGARDGVEAFVAEWWDTEMQRRSEAPDGSFESMPADMTTAVERYFEVVDDEDYVINHATIGD